jgi:hypothetical protein
MITNITAIFVLALTAAAFFCFGKLFKDETIDKRWGLRFNTLFSAICGNCLGNKNIKHKNMCSYCRCKPLLDMYRRLETDDEFAPYKVEPDKEVEVDEQVKIKLWRDLG